MEIDRTMSPISLSILAGYVVLVTLAGGAAAQERQTGATDPVAIARSAQRYSIDWNTIGIFLNLAPDTQLPAELIGDSLVKRFESRGIQTRYFTNYAKAGHTSVDYFVKGVPYGPYSLGNAKEGLEYVVRIYRKDQAPPDQ